MRASVASCTSIIISISLCVVALGQSRQGSTSPGPQKKTVQPKAAPEPEREAEGREQQDAVKLQATLIAVPVIASDRGGLYVPDLRKEDFAVYEDGVKQEIAFFATTKEPFHVVLLIDTSASTKDQIRQIQKAARAFVEQLQAADRVKVIAFADEVQDLSDFTSDQAELRNAIERSQPGQGTKLYDAMQRGLSALRQTEGRKAIVIFTDGVDMGSVSSTFDDNLRAVEESGVIVYPIRYNTRATVEAIVRDQQRNPAGIPGRSPGGTTPTTVPGDTRVPTGNVDLSIPSVILDRFPKDPRIPDTRSPDTRNPGGRYPDQRYPDSRYPDRRYPDTRYPDDPNNPNSTRGIPEPGRRPAGSTDPYLDNLYRMADDYLNQLAAKSGGKLHRADSLPSLPLAFEQIAAELRTQYSLGYYPANAARDGGYRRIQVRTSRKDVVVRARPGYRAPSGA